MYEESTLAICLIFATQIGPKKKDVYVYYICQVELENGLGAVFRSNFEDNQCFPEQTTIKDLYGMLTAVPEDNVSRVFHYK